MKRAVVLAVSAAYWAIETACKLVRCGLGRDPRARCVILYYHGIGDEQRARFHTQMARLRSWTRVIPLARLGSPGLAGWSVCITFDDGLDSVRRNAVPSLVELGLPASVFVVTGNLGRCPQWPIDPRDRDAAEPVMTAEHLTEIAGAGVEIGSHTVSHPNLTTVCPEELRAELVESKRALETLLGQRVRELSLPFGAYDRSTLRVARAVGYEFILTIDPQLADPGGTDGIFGRFKTDPDDWRAEFWLKARGAYGWRGHIDPLRRVWPALGARLARSRMATPGPALEAERRAAALTTPGPQD